MKKQLLIAAVAATMTSAAMADISISGDAKFEYQNVEATGSANTNKTNTEVNLKLRGKSGDTTVVMDIAANGAVSAANGSGLVVEDQYLTTKVGDVSVKAGNYASGTSGILGEIDNGGRSHGKVTLSTTLGGANVYVGNNGVADSAASTDFTTIDNTMFAGVSMDVAGMTVQAKKNSSTVNSFAIAGEMSGVALRLEQKQNDAANSDVTFGNVTTDVNGISLGYAWIDADGANLVTENDSAIFAVEMGALASSITTEDGQSQITAATSVAGNKVTVKSGTIDNGIAAGTDLDYMQVSASRALASGATATVTYTDKDTGAATDSQTFEAELSVKF